MESSLKIIMVELVVWIRGYISVNWWSFLLPSHLLYMNSVWLTGNVAVPYGGNTSKPVGTKLAVCWFFLLEGGQLKNTSLKVQGQ